MELTKQFALGVVFGMLLLGCSSASFSYHFYGLDAVEYSPQGHLLGPTPPDDLPFMRCAPSDKDPHPCIVMLTDDFYALKQDYLDTKNKLISCQKSQ